MELFQMWMNTSNPDENNPIPLDLRRTVWCAGAARGGEREWRFLTLRLQAARVAAARDAMLAAMACTRQVWLLNQFLEWAVSENSPVRKQDAAAVVGNVARTPVGYYVAREFFYNRIDDLFKTFNGQSRRFGYIIKTLLDQFTTQRELDEFLIFHDKNPKYFEETKLAVVQAIEKAKVNIDWVDQNKDLVVREMRKAVMYMNNNTQNFEQVDPLSLQANNGLKITRHSKLILLVYLSTFDVCFIRNYRIKLL
ncbi:aminopeptidase N isoform X1 [Bombyx mori]|uniref:aminopeptidase N isoform X1 n=1 Tax=Bombyx mori TaxID=7091 RepID=UPI002ED67014